MKKTTFALILLVISLTEVGAGEIRYELYERNDGERLLVASGVKNYTANDFYVSPEDRNGQFYGTRKVLELHDGFGVGILETYDSAGGFGLSVEHLPLGSNPNDFSWEWYDPAGDPVFIKRQGGTRVRVSFSGLPATSSVKTIEFLTSVEYDYIVDICCKDSDGDPTYVLRILPGSVLDFPQ